MSRPLRHRALWDKVRTALISDLEQFHRKRSARLTAEALKEENLAHDWRVSVANSGALRKLFKDSPEELLPADSVVAYARYLIETLWQGRALLQKEDSSKVLTTLSAEETDCARRRKDRERALTLLRDLQLLLNPYERPEKRRYSRLTTLLTQRVIRDPRLSPRDPSHYFDRRRLVRKRVSARGALTSWIIRQLGRHSPQSPARAAAISALMYEFADVDVSRQSVAKILGRERL